ncbi:hypothetical protein [Hafnia psychrotolerans]|uniref:Uncharacterized protein n=1 Tax=Hafnia psychrotolerans TaxID=1477018 RepID=A0ABQ1GJA8_9GAMM|nr:hypothetical protein [Hafnia psychrotolerans]GGA44960.1 hypothetical protein GCM10011328_20130 [Hafnia psychrotolerans]
MQRIEYWYKRHPSAIQARRFALTVIIYVRENIAKGAPRIFMTGVEINQDTLMEYLNDRLTFARISENKQLENSLRIAIEMVENNKGNL